MSRYKQASPVHSHIGPRDVRSFQMSAQDVAAGAWQELPALGIHIDEGTIYQMMDGMGMDASNNVGLSPSPLSTLTTASISTPIQFLQAWMPGFVPVVTAARKIDDLVGVTTLGSFSDEQIVQGVLEGAGQAQPYTDYGVVPMSGWNVNFEQRTIVRFEMGMSVGYLEDQRSAAIRMNTAAEKRNWATMALDIQRNRVGFYGYNDGSGLTYGFLNDPGLPSYQTVASGVGGYTWALKTFNEITADIRTAMAGLQIASMDTIDPQNTPVTMAVAMSCYQYLAVVNSLGTTSVMDWINKTYPKLRIVSVPELDGANSTANVAYFYAENINDGGSDGGAVFVQCVPARFLTIGVEKRAKNYLEDYANATAGVMCKRPYAVYRISGI